MHGQAPQAGAGPRWAATEIPAGEALPGVAVDPSVARQPPAPAQPAPRATPTPPSSWQPARATAATCPAPSGSGSSLPTPQQPVHQHQQQPARQQQQQPVQAAGPTAAPGPQQLSQLLANLQCLLQQQAQHEQQAQQERQAAAGRRRDPQPERQQLWERYGEHAEHAAPEGAPGQPAAQQAEGRQPAPAPAGPQLHQRLPLRRPDPSPFENYSPPPNWAPLDGRGGGGGGPRSGGIVGVPTLPLEERVTRSTSLDLACAEAAARESGAACDDGGPPGAPGGQGATSLEAEPLGESVRSGQEEGEEGGNQALLPPPSASHAGAPAAAAAEPEAAAPGALPEPARVQCASPGRPAVGGVDRPAAQPGGQAAPQPPPQGGGGLRRKRSSGLELLRVLMDVQEFLEGQLRGAAAPPAGEEERARWGTRVATLVQLQEQDVDPTVRQLAASLLATLLAALGGQPQPGGVPDTKAGEAATKEEEGGARAREGQRLRDPAATPAPVEAPLPAGELAGSDDELAALEALVAIASEQPTPSNAVPVPRKRRSSLGSESGKPPAAKRRAGRRGGEPGASNWAYHPVLATYVPQSQRSGTPGPGGAAPPRAGGAAAATPGPLPLPPRGDPAALPATLAALRQRLRDLQQQGEQLQRGEPQRAQHVAAAAAVVVDHLYWQQQQHAQHPQQQQHAQQQQQQHHHHQLGPQGFAPAYPPHPQLQGWWGGQGATAYDGYPTEPLPYDHSAQRYPQHAWAAQQAQQARQAQQQQQPYSKLAAAMGIPGYGGAAGAGDTAWPLAGAPALARSVPLAPLGAGGRPQLPAQGGGLPLHSQQQGAPAGDEDALGALPAAGQSSWWVRAALAGSPGPGPSGQAPVKREAAQQGAAAAAGSPQLRAAAQHAQQGRAQQMQQELARLAQAHPNLAAYLV